MEVVEQHEWCTHQLAKWTIDVQADRSVEFITIQPARNVPFKTLVMCVPPVWKEDDDEYAPYNNLDHLPDQPMLMISAQQDEDIPLADAKWLFAQLPMADKRFITYPSGHSLPMDYVPEAIEWFTQRL